MNKIGWGQLGIVLALSRIFTEAANFPRDDINYGMQRFTVIILSFALLAAVLAPVYFLLKRREGENVFSAAAERSPAAARVLAVIYIAVMFTMMTTAIVQTQFYSGSTIFDAAPAWLLILFVLIACLYGFSKGLPAVARAGVVIAGGFAALLALVFFGVYKDIRPEYLYPAIAERPEALPGEVVREFSKNSEAAVFIALCSRVRERAGRSLLLYGCLSASAMLLMTFLYNTVLGEYLNVTSFPFYRLASISNVTFFQRLDGIDAMVWTTSAIVKLSLMTFSVRTAVQSAFGSLKAANISAVSVLLLSAGTGLFFSHHTVDFAKISLIPETGITVFAAVTLIPFTALLMTLKKRKSAGLGRRRKVTDNG